MAYFDTSGASNGPTEAINGIIELGRRTARGYRNPTNYQLRMLLIAGGLDAPNHEEQLIYWVRNHQCLPKRSLT